MLFTITRGAWESVPVGHDHDRIWAHKTAAVSIARSATAAAASTVTSVVVGSRYAR